jgi:Zn-dependent M28 family amino/carboxypeptidase
LSVRGGGEATLFRWADDFVGGTQRVVDATGLDNSELVFVGYGIVAPEYDWNDYEGVDARGKTVVVLVNDPGFATQDTALFRGNAMTYYGRWTYKYEEAGRQGAEGILIVHETAPAAYGWDVVRNGWTGPQFMLETPDGNMSRAAVEGWVSLETARRIFAMAGRDYEALKEQAVTRDFSAVPLGVTASVSMENTILRSRSYNVLARVPGTDRADEYVVYMAHWDHLGTDTSRAGDQIFNGARDNATGTAALLEIAEAFKALSAPPSRSVLFLATTAEEQGLLGSLHYALNPVAPLNKTVAALNMDAMNFYGPTRDVLVVGYGNSELDDFAEQAAADDGRYLRPDQEPEKGFYYRSDHFPFARQGVPSLYIDPGIDHVERGEAYGREQLDRYTAERYHQPSDEYDESWDLSGMAQDLQLLFRIGYRLANSSAFPNWREGTEFRAVRDSMMR